MKRRPQLITNILAGIMLLIAIAPMPVVYYDILRWVVCIAALHLESIGYFWRKHGTKWVIIVFACIAMLFNPFAPADLDGLGLSPRALWIILDTVCSILFFATLYIEQPPEKAMLIKIPNKENYGLREVIIGLIGAAFFTGIAFWCLLFIREVLKIFPKFT